MFFLATASFAVPSSSEIRVVSCWICGSRDDIRVRMEAMLVSSVVIGEGWDSVGDLNLIV
jgi:hypothetical protein